MSSCCCLVCINTSEVGIVERLGKYSRFLGAGVNFIACPIESLADTVSTRVDQLDVACETKTKDNVFVNVNVSVQFQVKEDKIYEAYYELSDTESQIRAYVFDTVRSILPTMELDEAFEAKEELAIGVQSALKETMESYGYKIIQALITDLTPDARVKNAMNEINASRRLKESNVERAEGEKIQIVKAAEAESESKYLSGEGVAKQRKAIVDGLRDSIKDFSGNVSGATPKDVIDLLLMTQYFDMLKDVGSNPATSTVFLPSSNGGLDGAMRDGMMQAQSMRR